MAVTCLRCAHPDSAGRNFCSECDAPLPLTGEEDYFSILGLARVLGPDPGRLKAAYFELSRRLHPDVHVSDSPEVQDATLRRSALLNDAYQVLRDPVRRVRYLLSLEGRGNAEGRTTTTAANFELMETIQDAKLHEDPAVRELKLREAEAQVIVLKETALRFLDDLGRRWDALARPDEPPAPRESLLDEMLNRLDEIAYAERLLREVEESRTPEASEKGNRK